MSTPAQKAQQLLVKAGLNTNFATQVVAKSGHSPQDIIKNPTRILGDYWYDHINVDFLHDAVAVDVNQLRMGLTALELQKPVVDQACAAAPRAELLGHRDIFGWGVVVAEGRL